MVREFTINSLLDSDIRVSDLTREELKRLAYGAKYFEFGYGYDATEARVAKLSELRKAVLGLEAEEAAKAEEARRVREEAARQAREGKFLQAKETGKPVVLCQYDAPCNDPHEECDVDFVVVYAMPDGTTKTVRNHSW